jgi:hypothetical protein
VPGARYVASSPFQVSRFIVDAEFRTADRPRKCLAVGPFGGVARRGRAVRAIAPGIPPHDFPLQGRRSPTPRFYAAGAGGVTTVETCVSGGAPAAAPSDSNSSKVHRREG